MKKREKEEYKERIISEEKRKVKRIVLSLLALVLVVIILTSLVITKLIFTKDDKINEPQILTKATLEKIINVDDLSTYEAVYNGVAKVMNTKDIEKIDYYVSYEAKVKAGINMDEVKIEILDYGFEKRICVTLPEIKLQEPVVEIESMDFIFINKKANDDTVTQEAYKECKKDAKYECEKEHAIYNLARENAENIIKALIEPFVEQLDSSYKLEIK